MILIIAYYNEDLNWVSRYESHFDKIHIYNKNVEKQVKIPKDVIDKCIIEDIPNIGRESDTYLHHIINIYEECNDDDIFVFCLASISKQQLREDTLQELLNLKFRTNTNKYKNPYNFQINNWENNPLVLSNKRPFHTWFKYHFKDVKIEQVKCHGAIFKTHGANIKRFPKSKYVELKKECSVSQHIEVGHYLERTWKLIL